MTLEELKEQMPDGYKIVKEGEQYKPPDGHKLVKTEEFTRLAEAGNDLKKFKSALKETFGEDYDLNEIKAKVDGYEELKDKNTDDLEKRLKKLESQNTTATEENQKLKKQLRETNLRSTLSKRRLEKPEYTQVVDEFVNFNDLLALEGEGEELEKAVDTILDNARNRQLEVLSQVTGRNPEDLVHMPVGSPSRQAVGDVLTDEQLMQKTQQIMAGMGATGLEVRRAEQMKAREAESKNK